MTVKYKPESCDMGDEFGKKQFPVIGKGICGRCERYDGGDTDPQRECYAFMPEERNDYGNDNGGTFDETLRRVYGCKRPVLRDRGRACVRVSVTQRRGKIYHDEHYDRVSVRYGRVCPDRGI